MRIIVAAAGEQLECPYCHDALEGPRSACSQCRTVYHEECARNLGRCALLGCGASLGAQPEADARFALVLVPPPAPDDPAHVAALVQVIGFSKWDAEQKLRSRVPVILGWVERDRAEPAIRELEAAKLDAFAIHARALAGGAPFVVRFVTRDENRLVLTNRKGEKRALDLAAPRFVVTGRQANLLAKPSPGIGDEAAAVVHARDTLRFAHVYLPGEPVPIVFEQGEIHDFAFLGSAKAPSGYENSRVLGELLAAGQPSDSSLEPLGDTHLRGSGRGGGATYTNRAWVLATSRLIAHARAPWLAGGARP